MLEIDQTWQLGRFYIDLVGALSFRQFELGIIAEYSNSHSWGKRISLHLGFWCLSIGID